MGSWLGTWIGSWAGSWFGPPGGGAPPVTATEPTGILVSLHPEAAARVMYTWITDLFDAESGVETRQAVLRSPRVRYDQNFQLTTHVQNAALRAALIGHPVDERRLIALWHDSLTVQAAVSGSSLTVPSADLALWDWTAPGTRVLVYNDADQAYAAVVQSAAGSTISLDVPPSGGTYAAHKTKVAPLVATNLVDKSIIAPHPVNAVAWRASFDGYSPRSVMGTGADAIATLDTHYLLPDFLYQGAASAEEAFDSMAESVDFGAAFIVYAGATIMNVRRTGTWRARGRAQIQGLHKLLYTLRGRQKTFLYPTYRDDLTLYDALDNTTTVLVNEPGASVVDYFNDWHAFPSRRYLRFEMVGGAIHYRKVANVTDEVGHYELTVNAAIDGDVSRISLCEVSRLDGDTVSVDYALGGELARTQIVATAVQQ